MKKIFLIGYMGCGKSSLGRKLAKVANMEFMDMDSIIEQREGASISDIFYYQGEEYFRAVERAVLEDTAQVESAVISTGGGLPVWGDNMEQMRDLGVTVYLRRSPKNIISRLSPYGRQKRPKFRGLNDEELLAFMTSHMAEREPVYSKADIVIDCDTMADSDIIDLIMSKIKNLKTINL